MRKNIYEMTPKQSYFSENFDIKIWGELHGGMVCSVHHFAPGTDITPAFEAVGGFCPVPHWGYCFRGQATMKYADGSEEVIRAGDVFYFPKGHTMIVDKNDQVDCEFIQFSIAADFVGTEDKIAEANKK